MGNVSLPIRIRVYIIILTAFKCYSISILFVFISSLVACLIMLKVFPNVQFDPFHRLYVNSGKSFTYESLRLLPLRVLLNYVYIPVIFWKRFRVAAYLLLVARQNIIAPVRELMTNNHRNYTRMTGTLTYLKTVKYSSVILKHK